MSWLGKISFNLLKLSDFLFIVAVAYINFVMKNNDSEKGEKGHGLRPPNSS